MVNLYKFKPKNFTREGSSPFSCRKYLWSRSPDFRKIYAHKWLCRAFCGHNIFFVVFSWRKRWDSNPRYVAVQLISSQSRYDHFDTLPNIISHKKATIILYTRKVDLSSGFDDLSKKIRNPPKKIKFIDKHRKKSYNLP